MRHARHAPLRALGSLLLCAALAPAAARGQSAPNEHHAAAPAAPASAAPPKLGEISFPTSSASPAAHDAFVTGVLYMHNFHYPRAADAFQQAERLDSGDVMAYWGEAMSYTHPVWDQQDVAAARAALAKLAPTREARLAKARTPRERAWLDAAETLYGGDGSKAQRDTAYAAAMAKIHAAYPRDDEATTFYALALLGLGQGERDTPTYDRAYALVKPVFAAHPHHPGAAHYLIHAVDDPAHARLGLAAARAYADIAPSAGHAIHMTSHIFLALGMWDDVVAANVRSLAASPPNRLSGHVVDWLHYGLVQQGRWREADHWIDSTMRVAAIAPPPFRADLWDAIGLMAAANLADTRRWSGTAGAVRMDSALFGADTPGETLADFNAALFGVALGALHRGERALFDSTLAAMGARRTAAAGDPLVATARGYSEVMEKTLRGYALREDHRPAEALALFRDAAAQEGALPVAFGPPMVIKPPREAAGELLLELKRPTEARAELLEALARAPGRAAPLLGLARAERALGHRAAAAARYRELADVWHLADDGNPDVEEARANAAPSRVARPATRSPVHAAAGAGATR